jgi:hypothetical protein
VITEDNFLPESNKFDDTSRLRCAKKDVEGPDRKHDTVYKLRLDYRVGSRTVSGKDN